MKPVVAALIASAWAQTTIAFSVPQQPLQNGPQGSSKQCPADAELSCHKTRPVPDTCCYNSPGGLLLLTQFWDAQPAVGPEDSWTLHGLWWVFMSLFMSTSFSYPYLSAKEYEAKSSPYLWDDIGQITAMARSSSIATKTGSIKTLQTCYSIMKKQNYLNI